jgi:plastocyanin
VVFFLHLGREKKPRWNLLFLISTIGIILVVVVGSIWIMNHLHYNMSATDVTNKVASGEGVYKVNGVPAGTCPEGTGTKHKIELKDNIATPSHVSARLCDTLTIINLDGTTHEINFGSLEKSEMYAGETEKTVRAGRNKVLTLTELGTHTFYDPKQSGISGSFTVTSE